MDYFHIYRSKSKIFFACVNEGYSASPTIAYAKQTWIPFHLCGSKALDKLGNIAAETLFPAVGKLGNIFSETLAHTNLKVLFMFVLSIVYVSTIVLLTRLVGK